MRIAIITSPFSCIPPHAIGAVEKLWYNIGKIFAQKGHKVNFISKKIKEYNNTDNDILITYTNGYKIKKNILLSLLLDFVYSFKSLVALKKTDILILNTFWTPILCPFFSRKYNVAIYNVARFPKNQFKYYKFINRLSCVSLAVYNELIKQTPSAIKQAKVIPNPVDTNVFFYKEEPLTEKIVISYAGRVHPEKGIDILIKAFDQICKRNSNIELRIIGGWKVENGGGGEKFMNSLKKLSNQKLIFIDPIYKSDDLAKELQKCNIFCYPSIAENGETFGVAPLEAMALGRTTIVSDLDCFKDFIDDKKNGFIFNHRYKPVENLVNLLNLLINDVTLRKKIGFKAASTALNFSNEEIANKYLEDFTFLLNNNDKTKI